MSKYWQGLVSKYWQEQRQRLCHILEPVVLGRLHCKLHNRVKKGTISYPQMNSLVQLTSVSVLN